jgi:hypothetical protein
VKIFNTEVFGFRAALRGLRNPMDSWEKSDTDFESVAGLYDPFSHIDCTDAPEKIGDGDLCLLKNLTNAGTEHRKALRMIQIWATWILPRYVWTEADTYKIGMTRMSCSTMHKLGCRDLTVDDFQDGDVSQNTLEELNTLGEEYRDLVGNKNRKKVLRAMKKKLPEGFLQRADVNFNYETALNIFRQRKNHQLPEWRFGGEGLPESICHWLHTLPHLDKLVEV